MTRRCAVCHLIAAPVSAPVLTSRALLRCTNHHQRHPKTRCTAQHFLSSAEEQGMNAIPLQPVQQHCTNNCRTRSYCNKSIHNYLMEEYGLTTWGSYLIFAVATIILGALLGLVLIYIIDLVYSPKHLVSIKEASNLETQKKTEKNSDDKLADEDIKDDLLDDAEQLGNELSGNKESNTEDSGEKSKSSSPTVKKRKPGKAD